MDKGTLDSIAKRWSERARSGEWAKTLEDPSSYVNTDSAYEKFRRVIDIELTYSPQSRILDLGCGTCDIWNTLIKHCPEKELYGIDFAEGMIETARQRYPAASLFIGNAHDVAEILPPALQFSAVVSRGVLVNHLGIEYFSEILDNVHPFTNGLIAFDYLNRDWFTGGRFMPNKVLYTSEEICNMVQNSKFKGSSVTAYDLVGREPVVVIRQKS